MAKKPTYEELEQRVKELENGVFDPKRPGEALQRSEERFRRLFEQASDAFFIHNFNNGKIVDANESACKNLGYTRDELLELNVSDIEISQTPEAIVDICVRAEKGRSVIVEGIHRRKDGSTFPVEISLGMLQDEDPALLLAIVRDTTERKQTEDERRLFKLVADKANWDIYWITPEGEFLYANEKASKALGYSQEDLVGEKVWDVDPEFPQEARKAHWDTIKEEKIVIFETKHKSKDGIMQYVEVCSTYIEIEGKEFELAFSVDISNRKRAEEALRESEAQLRQIIDLVPHFIFVKDETGKFEIVNKATAEVFGTTVEDLTGRRDSEFVATEEEMEHFRLDDLEVIRSGKTKFIPEEPITDSENNIRYLQTTKVPFTISGSEKPALLGVAVDITNIKLAEEAIRESEEHYRSLIHRIQAAVVVHDADTQIIASNPKAQELLGLTEDQILGKAAMNSDWKFLGTDGEGLSLEEYPVNQVLATQQPLRDFTTGIFRPNKSDVVWVLVNADLMLDDKGKIQQVIVTFMDISDRKQAEEALRESEEKLNTLLNATTDVAGLAEVDGTILAANDALAKSLGRKKEELIGKSMFDFLSAEVAERSRVVLQGIVASKKPLQWEDDHAGRYFANSVYPILDDNGNVKQLALFAKDTSERKQAENKLKESEERFRTIYENAPMSIDSFDKDGRCILWNKECEKIFGWTMEELNSRDNPLSLFYPDPHIQKQVIDSILLNPEGVFREWRPMTKDGSELVMLWASFRLPDETVISMGYDITENRKAEEQIAASLKEKEVLLREIHHRTKNNMQVMISLLKIQSANIEDKQVAEMFKESRDRIKSMSLVHEKLYQSKGLADVDFKGYVKSLVSSIFSSYGASAAGITPITETDDVSIGLETAIPCGLIINELVSNSLKYAFPGNKKGEIRVALRSFDEDALVLEVGDNGIGMPEDLDFRNTTSMGLHLVNILSEDQLHGKIELDRAGGTIFRIRFKNHKYAARI